MNQPYGADILMEYVIKGNSAVLKCSIPSFVADFVRVEAWIDEEGTELLPSDNYGQASAWHVFFSLPSPSFSQIHVVRKHFSVVYISILLYRNLYIKFLDTSTSTKIHQKIQFILRNHIAICPNGVFVLFVMVVNGIWMTK